ncbi:MAG TPA: ATP-binding protein [Actinomycetota bacterium]|nr:ATP-binding protein [Actinomycetota bacterium]
MRARFSIDLPADARSASLARGTLRKGLARLPARTLEESCLLTSELIANSLRHSDLAENDSIALEVWVDEDCVRIEICDPGSASGSTPVLRVAEDEAEGGRGLFILDRVARRWGVKREGRTCVWFEIPVGGPE